MIIAGTSTGDGRANRLASTGESAHVPAMNDPARALLRHTVATLAYRSSKAMRDAPPEFAHFRVGPSSREPVQIVAHMGDLFDWALAMAQGVHRWKDSTPLAWNAEVDRFFSTLAAFDDFLASDAPLLGAIEQLFQGPIADALTHTGQLTMLRRLAESPIRAENYARADIQIGQSGKEQPRSKVEF